VLIASKPHSLSFTILIQQLLIIYHILSPIVKRKVCELSATGKESILHDFTISSTDIFTSRARIFDSDKLKFVKTLADLREELGSRIIGYMEMPGQAGASGLKSKVLRQPDLTAPA
jgi:hypothetical protein